MEESGLLKERLHAITEKHRIQEDIRQKKQELDQEKLKLQHLKKKSLREQWLLQDSTSHNATGVLPDQQQTRALQHNIHRIEKEVEFLERKESMISTNESFILNRLKAVEKSPEEIIKEAQDSFVLNPSKVSPVITDIPEPLSPPDYNHTEPKAQRPTLFAMEINVSKNLLTGESTVLSTSSVPLEELDQHTGPKVYDDGRKCVYALKSPEGESGPLDTSVSELSANEVQQLLRSAALHRQLNNTSYFQNHNRREEQCLNSLEDQRERREGRHIRNRGNHLPRNNKAEKDLGCSENWQRTTLDQHRHGDQESQYSQVERNNQQSLRNGRHLGNQKEMEHSYDQQKEYHYSSSQARDSHRAQENHHGNPTHSIIRSRSRLNGGRPNGCPPPRSHDLEEVSRYQPQLCYTPANDIPLSDYIHVDKEELYCYSSPSYCSYSGPAHSDRVPSPLYADDTPYTILNTLDTTEPITAIFMGFQTAQDDSSQGHGFEGSLKAELVIIGDNEESNEKNSVTERKNHNQRGLHGYPAGSSASGKTGSKEGVQGRQMQRPLGPGIRKIQKQPKACCAVC
ncbi:uncharacterized protein ACBR49_011785 [Aulostomus maculatus]